MNRKYKVKITVIKKILNKDLVKKYSDDPEKWDICQHFQVGQEFIVSKTSPWQMPEGFCGWAWADIQKLIYGMARGGLENFVTCCTDGFRPVFFRLERIKD